MLIHACLKYLAQAAHQSNGLVVAGVSGILAQFCYSNQVIHKGLVKSPPELTA
jgi:hypothetical protein